MNFPIPNNAADMLLYIWKIIDLPSIPKADLLYSLSFDLFLFPPEKATIFVDKVITSKMLIKDENQNLSLSKALEQNLNSWQNERKKTILSKLLSAKQAEDQKKAISLENGSGFNVLLKAFLDKGTINRAVTVSNSALSIDNLDPNNGIIKVTVAGTKEETYYIDIDINKKILKHNCHDFQARRAENKKFCKHLVKLFLVLKEKNEKDGVFFLNAIAETINEWNFSD